MFRAARKLWGSIRLLKRAETAFSMVSRGEDEAAFPYLAATEKMLGPFTQYTFGIEPVLLEIFLKGCVHGVKANDYDWRALRDSILSASEYNGAEKLHLILYLEELATTAGVSLPMSNLVSRPAPTERVKRQLISRFPKLSEAR
jgi:hypothetical protein